MTQPKYRNRTPQPGDVPLPTGDTRQPCFDPTRKPNLRRLAHTKRRDFGGSIGRGTAAPTPIKGPRVIRTLTTLLISCAIPAPAFAADASGQDRSVAFDLTFATHVEAGIPEQDVYIQGHSATSEVWLPGLDARSTDAPLFSSAEPQPHDPAEPSEIGPFPKGCPAWSDIR